MGRHHPCRRVSRGRRHLTTTPVTTPCNLGTTPTTQLPRLLKTFTTTHHQTTEHSCPRDACPTSLFTRLINFNRLSRKRRAAFIRCARHRAIRQAAFQPITMALAPDPQGIGTGHECLTLGPIMFCKRCGATKSRSQGRLLKRSCRRWAPLGTRRLIYGLMRGKPNAFYRRVLANATLPVKRIHSKTTPSPRYEISAHLRHQTPPTTIKLSRQTVHEGTTFRQLPTPGIDSDLIVD